MKVRIVRNKVEQSDRRGIVLAKRHKLLKRIAKRWRLHGLA